MQLRNSRILTFFLGALIVGLRANSGAQAEDDPYAALQTFSSLTSKTINSSGCQVTGAADFERFKPQLSVIRDGWLNRDYSLDFYAQRGKQVFLFVVVKRLAEVLTETVYSNEKPNLCSFTINITYFDKLGQQRTTEAVTWRFTENKANQINWKNIDRRNFAEIAIDYTIAPEMKAWFSDEPSMSDNRNLPPSIACDFRFLRANGIFIHATTYCSKDYMDSPAGYYALAMARQCVSIGEDKLKSLTMSAMHELDAIVKQRGKAGACQWVDDVERDVMHAATP